MPPSINKQKALDSWQRRYASIAHFPPERREAIITSWGTSETQKSQPGEDCRGEKQGSSPLSLNNGACSAGPTPGAVPGHEYVNISLPTLGGGFLLAAETSFSLDEAYWKRDFLRHAIRVATGATLTPIVFWSLVSVIQEQIGKLAGIQDTDFKPFREHNFRTCFSRKQAATVQIVATPTGQHQQVKKYSCGEKYCFWCRSRDRKQLAHWYFRVVKFLGPSGFSVGS